MSASRMAFSTAFMDDLSHGFTVRRRGSGTLTCAICVSGVAVP